MTRSGGAPASAPCTVVFYSKVFCCQSCQGWLLADEREESMSACVASAIERARGQGWKISVHGSAYTCPGCLRG